MLPERRKDPSSIEICRILQRTGALKFGTFKLTSGRVSPYYIDLRVVPSFPDAFRRICTLHTDLVKNEIGVECFNRVAGIPVAGIPLASLVAYGLEKPFLYVRHEGRTHGRQRRVEGILAPGDRVLLVDDLITTGVSLKKAAKAVEAEGGLVKDAAVLLDREEGGREDLEREGITLHSLIAMSGLADKMYETGMIDELQHKTILKQIRKN